MKERISFHKTVGQVSGNFALQHEFVPQLSCGMAPAGSPVRITVGQISGIFMLQNLFVTQVRCKNA